MKRAKRLGQILIECPNTIFQLYVKDENELSKIEIFMNNIRGVRRLAVSDIYTWCNRQGIDYDVRFNYHKEKSIWKNVASYFRYRNSRYKYRLGYGTV